MRVEVKYAKFENGALVNKYLTLSLEGSEEEMELQAKREIIQYERVTSQDIKILSFREV